MESVSHSSGFFVPSKSSENRRHDVGHHPRGLPWSCWLVSPRLVNDEFIDDCNISGHSPW